MRPVLLAVFALVAAGCPEPQAPVVTPEPVVVDHWSPRDTTDAGQGSLGPAPLGRHTRRLSVQQLDKSLIALTGDGWHVDPAPGVRVEILPYLQTVLGQPDYLVEFREGLDTGSTFTKFMDNWAAEVCANQALADDVQPDPALRRFAIVAVSTDGGMPDARAAVLENLRLAKLHLHGVYLRPGDTASLEPLADVWVDVAARNAGALSNVFAYSAVCTLMVTDPEFVTY